MKKILFIVLIILTSCATSMKDGTRAKLRTDLSDDSTEIWQINSSGGFFTTLKKIENNAMVRAATTSRQEGTDCFIMGDLEWAVDKREFTTTSNETVMTSETSTSNFGSATTTYKAPVTRTHTYYSYSNEMYVRFLKKDECDELKKTKWRYQVHYNDDVESFIDTIDKIWIGVGIVAILSIAISASEE